jgi:eukaryotic-like serine/threonine-protein kinase
MLTGNLPFNSDDPNELARLHRETPPPSPSQFNHEINSSLEQIILKILSKEQTARYRTADQLGRILETYLMQPPDPGNPATHRVIPPLAPTPVAPHFEIPQNQTALEAPIPVEPDPIKTIDWINVILGFLAVLAVGGLIPFWLYIWLTLSAK